MDIFNDKIQLTVTEEEADIIQNALGKWIGPYSEAQIPTLTEGERQRAAWKRRMAGEMVEKIQQELIERYSKRGN